MANIIIPSGVPTQVYVGEVSNSNVAPPLKKILATRTTGIIIRDTMPKSYVVSKGRRLPVGFREVEISLAFLAEDDLVWRIAKGLRLDEDINNPPRTDIQYCLFLLYPNLKAKKSFWFPFLEIDNPLGINYNKDKSTVLPLRLVGTNRDPSETLIARGNYDDLLNKYNYPDLRKRRPIVW